MVKKDREEDTGSNLFSEVEGCLDTLKRHISVIKSLLMEQPKGIIKISQETSLPEHKIRYSLRMLEKQHIITPSKEGAILTPEFIASREELVNLAKKFKEQAQSIYDELNGLLISK